jgi:hypothetical protein
MKTPFTLYKELMIGNRIIYGGNEIIVEGVVGRKIYHSRGKFDQNIEPAYNPFRPIPLTEEWLIRFGARPFQNGFIIDKYPHMEYFLWSNAYNMFVWQRCEARLRGIEYVHQLQNLYFAVTSTELTLKDNQ